MCRMNVEIKWLLMKRYASYWNMLLEEMQLLIMSYRDGQARVDMRRSVAGKRMCRQIREYGLLRLEWDVRTYRMQIARMYLSLSS